MIRSSMRGVPSLSLFVSASTSKVKADMQEYRLQCLQNHKFPAIFIVIDVGTSFDVKKNENLHFAMVFAEPRSVPCGLCDIAIYYCSYYQVRTK